MMPALSRSPMPGENENRSLSGKIALQGRKV
jgi:hypothetical protein